MGPGGILFGRPVHRRVQASFEGILQSSGAGTTSVATLALNVIRGDSSPMAGLGRGDIESWIAYPILA